MKIMVTIVCTVYNHGKYLRETLDSLTKQKTSFSFEIIVHDDASTDDSASIIREYENKYPLLIKAIYQSENQFSKGVGIYDTFIIPIIKGKYVAICEGDDFWIDECKLEKQVAYMESHPDCSFCFTNAIMLNVQNGKKRKMLPYSKKENIMLKGNGVFNLGQLSKLSFVPYASFLYPTKNYSLFPAYYNERCFGNDRKLSLYSTAIGYAYYLNEVTCCYRYGVSNSAMTKSKSKAKIAEIERSFINLNNNINKFSNYSYEEDFRLSNLQLLRNIYMLSGSSSLSKEELSFVKSHDTFVIKIVRFFVKNMPEWLFNFLRNMKRKL